MIYKYSSFIVNLNLLFLQELFVLQKREGQLVKLAVFPVRFVPMTGAVQQGNREAS